MKIFISIQKYFESLGVTNTQLLEKSVLNSMNSLGLFNIWLFSILTGSFLLFKAETFGDFADTYYVFSTVLGAAINYTYVVIEMPKLFKLIQNMEILIGKRKFETTQKERTGNSERRIRLNVKMQKF